MEQYADRVFLPAKAVNRSEKTVYSYKWTFEKYITPALGRYKLTEVTSAQITSFLLDFQATGAAHSSVSRLYAILKSFFKMAYLDESIDRNPMDKVQRPEPRKDELRKSDAPEAYTAEEVAYILDCLKEAPLKWQAYISVLCDTGIRRGEGIAIRWADVDFTKLEIDINGSVSYTPETGILRTTPKSGKRRTVDITAKTAALLRQLREEQAGVCISEYVFTQDGTPNPMHPDTPNRYMRAFGKRYGIENFHPHKLRHSYASIAITNGEDIVSVSENLGHADTSITLRTYSHASEESRKRTNAGYHKAIEAARGESKSKSS
ncbi:MAG: site-specific integrase [Clostridiales bacterium]|nr:site-specific integrase [Clostridiales bacterium]